MPLAPVRFANWMTANTHVGKKCGHTYRYHSRSDSHSKAMSLYVLDDLLDRSVVLRTHAAAGKVVYGVNLKYTWVNSAKEKTIDLAIGVPAEGEVVTLLPNQRIAEGIIGRVLFSMEAKSAMTEHGKSQPRIFDELGSSHAIVHAGADDAIAAGLTVVNIAGKFVSPLRQFKGQPLVWTQHKQPHAAQRMVEHLRGLPIRTGLGTAGFDAYTTVVIDCDNQGPATLWTAAPAPQPGERDHYETFLTAAVKAYEDRFSVL